MPSPPFSTTGSCYQQISGGLCDAGTLSGTCDMTTPTVLTNGDSLSGTGKIVLSGGGKIYTLNPADSVAINMADCMLQ